MNLATEALCEVSSTVATRVACIGMTVKLLPEP